MHTNARGEPCNCTFTKHLEWEDGFKRDREIVGRSYTREDSTRLNVTFESPDGWRLAAMIEEAKPGTRCAFHPWVKAVAFATGRNMCPDCTDRFQRAVINTNKDMRLVDQQAPYMLSKTAWSLPEGHGQLESEYQSQGIKDNIRCMMCGHIGPMVMGVCPKCGNDDGLMSVRWTRP